ncbi:MAG TPA: PAS domain-containing sensor histidine kinase [Candidatus Desulfovibrio intestinavium]|uniref:histidine kinase n=1 Tax=Candidatus Desulfovibrio intestinavium TaxID=2838534 RepID=A0A9D2KSG2_9BACT|nr:PAS domain-containing sensor histidine kinase [Candidatus Desulfovibrio intestinavium]
MKALWSSFRFRIFCAVLVAALASGVIGLFSVRVFIQDRQLDDFREMLLRHTRLAAGLVQEAPDLAQGMRLVERSFDGWPVRCSVADAQGRVLLESAGGVAPESMDNHSDRPEMREAAASGVGFAIRHSATLGQDFAYAASALSDGRILRLALPLPVLEDAIAGRMAVLSQVALVAAVVAIGLAVLLSGALRASLRSMIDMVEDLSRGHFRRRLCRLPGHEFAPLVEAVNRMAANIEREVRHSADQAAQLEAVLDTMSDGVLVLGPQGQIRRCNAALVRLFPLAGRQPGAQVIEAIPHPALQEAVDSLLAEKMDAAGGSAQRQLTLELPTDISLAVVLSRSGLAADRLGLVAVFRDVSAFVRLERVRRDFVANVSHELRTPLTAIQGSAETLLELDGEPQERRFAEIIYKHACALSRMVDDLLQLARLDAQPVGALEDVAAGPVLEQVQALCRGPLEARRLELLAHVPADCVVRGHARLLMQVFRNLVENACRYAPEGSAVRVFALPEDQWWRFRVVDDGPGIPEAEQSRIFERFYQVERHRSQGGTGLGLAICKHAVEQCGGQILVRSPAPDGSTSFEFTLARCGEHSPAKEENA